MHTHNPRCCRKYLKKHTTVTTTSQRVGTLGADGAKCAKCELATSGAGSIRSTSHTHEHTHTHTHTHTRMVLMGPRGPGLTPLQRSQLQVLQDQLVQHSFHAGLPLAPQRRVSSWSRNTAARTPWRQDMDSSSLGDHSR